MKSGVIIGMFPDLLKPCIVPFYPCYLVTEIYPSIVSRIISDIPSQVRQEIEFIRPLVEERLAKMEEYGDDWDDKPVCRTIYLLFSH